MSDETFVNGLVIEHGVLKGKPAAAVQYGDGCLKAVSISFAVGDVIKSQIIPLANGKHEHDVVGRVSSKPRTLENQRANMQSRGVPTVTQSAPVDGYEFPVPPEIARAIAAAADEMDHEPVSDGRSANPFSDSFTYDERPTPTGGKQKPVSAFDDPRGGGNVPGRW